MQQSAQLCRQAVGLVLFAFLVACLVKLGGKLEFNRGQSFLSGTVSRKLGCFVGLRRLKRILKEGYECSCVGYKQQLSLYIHVGAV